MWRRPDGLDTDFGFAFRQFIEISNAARLFLVSFWILKNDGLPDGHLQIQINQPAMRATCASRLAHASRPQPKGRDDKEGRKEGFLALLGMTG